ncbi:MAG: membrane protein [Candidatus Gallionella acididurans]|uniref:Membrane protein n=1 Tax=Candidatus Gallionella acididurans TaxID=1796491 RepID=A0A139BSR8_9PROT|nr:MAG: membrane protein [Candidatus Gallionella acididurans]
MRISLSAIHSLMAGYADTSGFLALKGLFTSHVTGNFVTLGSALVLGSSGALAKILALPTFCLAVLSIRLIGLRLRDAGRPALRSVLTLQFVLLIVAAAIAVWAGPFDDPDTGAALALGMVLVTAMAMQNAAHRVHLSHTPPSTVMTGSTTQIMLDLGDMIHGLPPEKAATIRARFRAMTTSIVLFATGCGLAALLFAKISMWCFCVLPLLGAFALMRRSEIVDARA